MPSLLDLLGETWPARMAKSAWNAAKLPGDVYAGRVDPLSEEGIGRAADLGGLVMGGTYAGAPRGAMGAGAVKPIRAYHGSPHDFDRFDLSKIGTGEGAQAYGHGLYFAENPAVAKQYRETLAPSRGKLPDDIISLPPEMRQAIMAHAGSDVDAVTAAKRAQYMSSALREVDLPKVTDMVERARAAKKGRMYEVNINAAPEHFLDWNKALSEMSPEVQKALSGFSPHMTGAQINESARLVPGAYRDNRVATENLRERGIPGIKYLDEGSRGNWTVRENPKGFYGIQSTSPGVGGAVSENFPTRELAQDWVNKQRTSNFVLFRDDIIDIVKKYGLAGAAAMYGISQDEAKAAMEGSDKKLNIGRQKYGDEE